MVNMPAQVEEVHILAHHIIQIFSLHSSLLYYLIYSMVHARSQAVTHECTAITLHRRIGNQAGRFPRYIRKPQPTVHTTQPFLPEQIWQLLRQGAGLSDNRQRLVADLY